MTKYESLEGGFTPERTQLLVEWVGSGRRVLDLGCYDGRDSKAIADAGNTVTGVEIHPRATDEARRRGIDVQSFDIATDEWPLPEEGYDVVIAGEIIEHLVDPDSFLQNVRRHLRKDGRLILTTPNVASLGRRLMLLVGKNPYLEFSSSDDINGFPTVGHVRYFTKRTLVRLCSAHGFRLVRLTSDRLNIGPFSSVRLAQLAPTLSWRFIAMFRLVEKADEHAEDSP